MLNNSTHFKIMYEGTLLGVFSVCLPENFNNLINTIKSNEHSRNDYKNLVTLFKPFFRAFSDDAKYDIIDKNDYKYHIDELVEQIMSKTGFVVIWQLSNKAKKKIDVNQVSLVKIFFQKLTELIKNTGAKYIIAQGKDKHVTKAYIKLGGFNGTEELFNEYASIYNKDVRDFIEGTVIKRI